MRCWFHSCGDGGRLVLASCAQRVHCKWSSSVRTTRVAGWSRTLPLALQTVVSFCVARSVVPS